MKIIVCIKQVPDTASVKIDPVTNNLVREGIPCMINPCDEYAIVKALEMKRHLNAAVVLLSMGPPQSKEELLKGLMMGADEAYLLCGRPLSGADTLATGYALAETIKRIGYDLVICGNEAVDGCTGQVGPGVGEHLGIPSVTYVTDIKADKEGIAITRDAGKSIDTYLIQGKTVICMKKPQKMEVYTERRSNIPKVQILDTSFLDQNRIGAKGSPTKVASISVIQKADNCLEVDYRWSCEKRIDYIMRGGMERRNTKVLRGKKEKLAEELLGFVNEKEETICRN